MNEIQSLLGLPTLDKTRTRQLVRAYFELYRQYKWLLSMDMEPHPSLTRARPGYEDAMDPRFIHGNRVHADGPGGLDEDMDVADRLRRQFCTRVEERVRRLKDYQRDIIRHHYMYQFNETQPTDDETWNALKKNNWYVVSKRYYEQEKAKAVMLMAAAFRVEQYRERLHR